MSRTRPQGGPGERWCSAHKCFHPVEFFVKRAAAADGLSYRCREAKRKAFEVQAEKKRKQGRDRQSAQVERVLRGPKVTDVKFMQEQTNTGVRFRDLGNARQLAGMTSYTLMKLYLYLQHLGYKDDLQEVDFLILERISEVLRNMGQVERDLAWCLKAVNPTSL